MLYILGDSVGVCALPLVFSASDPHLLCVGNGALGEAGYFLADGELEIEC